MPHVLSVSYDVSLLRSRRMLLEARGYTVTCVSSFKSALDACRTGSYDLAIIGHSIPLNERQQLVSEILAHCSAPVVALRRSGEPSVKGAVVVDAFDPKLLLDTVDRLLVAQEKAS